MDLDFIEVNRIVKKDGNQEIVPETMRVTEIKTFRPWYKSSTDTFKGDAVLVVLYSKNKVTGQVNPDKEDSNLPTMMICESYESFKNRLRERVIVLGK